MDLFKPRHAKEILFFVRDGNNIIVARFTACRIYSKRD